MLALLKLTEENKMIKVKLYDEEVVLKLHLYAVKDFMDKELPGLAILLEDNEGETMEELTVSFGEFIGTKNCAYVDTNNIPEDVIASLVEAGYMKDTGLTKRSGFCVYPLYQFDEAFLKEIGSENYEKYSDTYNNYMTWQKIRREI